MAAVAQFGSDLDASTQRLLNRGSKLTELLKQNQYSPMTVGDQVVSVFAGVNGYLDDLELSQVKQFESDLSDLIKSSHKDILDSINSTGNLDDTAKAKLSSIIEDFKKTR
jgi:F-type H+-transporting ATPase subunit alpha